MVTFDMQTLRSIGMMTFYSMVKQLILLGPEIYVKTMQSHGFKGLRFWENDIKRDIDASIKEILRFK
jgi:hypothetical protein